ncbi:cation transporter, partial [Salmonella enterica subsp. enterica serovar Agona]|nr:cation transporter [Salmonella enterica subsp. enterica serovar Agona]
DEKNLNVRAAALHVMGDLLGSVGAIVAALIIIWTGWTPADPMENPERKQVRQQTRNRNHHHQIARHRTWRVKALYRFPDNEK